MGIKLSICIPTYNRAKFLPDLLDSIVKQIDDSNKNIIEVVISDNASKDNTKEVIDSYRSKIPNLVYFRWDENKGADRNFIKVVELASGDYCWLMGSDDVIIASSITFILNQLNLDFDVFLCNRIDTNIKLEPYKYNRWLKTRRDFSFDLEKRNEFIKYLKLSNSLGALFSYISSIIIKKKMWNNVICNEDFIGTNYYHSYVILYAIKNHSVKLRYLDKPLILNRGENDSFLDRGFINRVYIDFKGYHKLSLIFKDDREIINCFYNVLKKEYPYYRVIKVLCFARKTKELENLKNWFLKIGYSYNLIKIAGLLSFFYPFLIYVKKKLFLISFYIYRLKLIFLKNKK